MHEFDGAATTFMQFASITNLEILREAVQQGGCCNRRNAHQATPLYFAAAQHAFGPGPESIRMLLEYGAEIDRQDASVGIQE